MRAFVTGGTGLLGSNLIRALIWEGWNVKAVVRPARKAHDVISDRAVSLITGDMRDVDAFASELAGCDVIFHAAAQRDGDGEFLRQANVKGTVHLLTHARRAGIRKVIYVAHGFAPDDTDGAIARFVHHYPELQVTTIVPGWMLGPNDSSPTPAGRVIAEALAGKPLPDFGTGACIVDARDVACAMLEAVASGAAGERYTVGGQFYPAGTIAEVLGRVAEVRLERQRSVIASLKRLVRGFQPVILDSERAVNELGVRFRPLEETMRDTVDWFRNHRQDRTLAAVA